MLHFASYNELLSEHAGSCHPVAGGFALFIIVAAAVIFVA
jgi:hypothetical protein